MFDIFFDIVARDIVMQDNDFATTDNPSTQNGGILLNSRCANIDFPMFGIGLEDSINANGTKLAYEMNRWKAQAIQDGATLAKWASSAIPGDVNMEISYL